MKYLIWITIVIMIVSIAFKIIMITTTNINHNTIDSALRAELKFEK